MTKDEIFNKHSFSAIGAISASKDFCLKAMDEFAKQQAIAFAEYCGNYGEKGPIGAWSEHMWSGNIMMGEPDLTTEHLYNQFIEQQNKDNDK